MSTASDRDRLIALLSTGEAFPNAVAESIAAEGPAVIPTLIAIAGDEDLADADAPGGGWVPVHAVDMLGTLKAAEAVDTILTILADEEIGSALWDTALFSLPKLGAAIVEPTLAALEDATDALHLDALCSALAQVGVRDDRIFDAIREAFDENPLLGSISFSEYGDTRALPLIADAIRSFVPDWTSELAVRDLIDYVDAYETLGEELPDDVRKHVDDLRAEWARRQGAGAGNARSTKVGRNDPCPCKSGKKYKKCCIDKPLATSSST